LSSTASKSAWRFRAKSCSGYGFALAVNAERYFFSARTVIEGNGIAAGPAGSKPGSSSAGAPIGGTNRVPKGGSITVTGSVPIANAAGIEDSRPV
jgi:hypothetical protein